MYSHQYLAGDFFHDIYAKKNIVSVLERELASPSWKREVVNIGGVTDSYQPAEKTMRLMPDILKLMIRHKTPVIISSKSDLILRDYDLIDELSRITYVNIAETVTVADEKVRSAIEPNSAGFELRMAVLREFAKTNASTGLHMMPIIPYVTDSTENIEAVFSSAADCAVSYVLTGTLYLRGNTRPLFLDFMKKTYPAKYDVFCSLYAAGAADKGYKTELYAKVNALRRKYNLSSDYSTPMKEK